MFGPVKRLVKRVFTRLTPEMATAIMSARARRHSHRMVGEWGLLDLNKKLVEHYGSVVRNGPFRGMMLTRMAHQEHLGPFLLGTYEEELHPWLEAIVNKRFAQVLDVGAKFGYYAVGLALRMPGIPVIAFDTDWWARAATREMAAANRISTVSPAGFCSPQWLNAHLLPSSFVLSDCEGYEGTLFTQATTPAIDSATLLIEVHDTLVAGVGAALRARFAQTHTSVVVAIQPRRPPTEILEFLSPGEADMAVREYRGPQEWMLFTPRGNELQ